MNLMHIIKEVGKDRDKTIDSCMTKLDEFCKTHEVIHFQITEAQVVDPSKQIGRTIPGMQGVAITPDFEMRVYCLYRDCEYKDERDANESDK